MRLTTDERDAMIASFDLKEIIAASKRHHSKSSPGSDHLPYEILDFLIRHPAAQQLDLSFTYTIRLLVAQFSLLLGRLAL